MTKLSVVNLSVVLSVGVAVVAVGCWSYSTDNGGGAAPGTATATSTGTGTCPSPTSSASSSSSATLVTTGGPCDIFGSVGNTCVAAHSTVRALYSAYTGKLYQVTDATGATKDISVVDGIADSASQDQFCGTGAASTCVISRIYDQSPNGNDLVPAPTGGGAKPTADNPAGATDLPTTLKGHTVYGVLIKTGRGYRSCTTGGPGNCPAVGTAVGDEPETEYMVTTPKDVGPGCCFDYGNAEVDMHDDNAGTMEAVYFGGGVVWGSGAEGNDTRYTCVRGTCSGNGPWIMADLENGVFAGWSDTTQDQGITSNPAIRFDFITAMIVGDTSEKNNCKGRFAVYGADAQNAATVTTLYDGIRPQKPGYVPQKKQGSIILGTGGDNSANGGGDWFEGVMTKGAATKATLDAVQANIVAAGYGK